MYMAIVTNIHKLMDMKMVSMVSRENLHPSSPMSTFPICTSYTCQQWVRLKHLNSVIWEGVLYFWHYKALTCYVLTKNVL